MVKNQKKQQESIYFPLTHGQPSPTQIFFKSRFSSLFSGKSNLIEKKNKDNLSIFPLFPFFIFPFKSSHFLCNLNKKYISLQKNSNTYLKLTKWILIGTKIHNTMDIRKALMNMTHVHQCKNKTLKLTMKRVHQTFIIRYMASSTFIARILSGFV